MACTSRRSWLTNVIRFGALAGLGGCGPSGVMEPPNIRRANSPKSETPPNMKPQEKFDPRKLLRDKAAGQAK
jgi:hypothetical protein